MNSATKKLTLEEIISGDGEIEEILGIEFKKLSQHINLVDGSIISVQCSKYHYCNPRVDVAKYESVEVGFIDSNRPPESWKEYASDVVEWPDAWVYAFVPVDLVREYVESCGGEK